MQASVAEEGSPIGMLNVAFMLQHGLGYGAPDRHALAYDLLLRAARLERYYGDGLVDAAAIMYDGDRYACLRLRPCVLHPEPLPQWVVRIFCTMLWPVPAASMGTWWPWQDVHMAIPRRGRLTLHQTAKW